ncbi:MAG: ATP-binding cassette domain-containing protein [Kiritimatiellia bacterium]
MISLELKRGDSRWELLGHNGSGKTTLLRLIARIFLRTAATWCCAGGSGRSSPWARASIRMSGREHFSVRGDPGDEAREIRAEVRRDSRLRRGARLHRRADRLFLRHARARLGFSVAVHTDPDILLVDEVLAVGDMAFRAKCYRKIHELMQREIGVVFVSHSMDLVTAHLLARPAHAPRRGSCTRATARAIALYEREIGRPSGWRGQAAGVGRGGGRIGLDAPGQDCARTPWAVGAAGFVFTVAKPLIRQNFMVGILNAEASAASG